MADFSHLRNWVFDLDNTLYSPHTTLFPQIHRRMQRFMEERLGLAPEAADALRRHYFYTYGTSLRGLMIEHQTRPEDFMDYVHDIDLAELRVDEALNARLRGLPGRKFIFTNADRRHAARILDRLGLSDAFEAVFDIADGDYVCKPERAPYAALLARHGLQARETAMAEDMAQNLVAAHELGMTTLWLRHDAEWLRHKPAPDAAHPHCHYTYADLPSLLDHLHSGIARP